MLLLASLPPYPGASHDPNQWLDSLMKVAHKSRKSIVLDNYSVLPGISIHWTGPLDSLLSPHLIDIFTVEPFIVDPVTYNISLQMRIPPLVRTL